MATPKKTNKKVTKKKAQKEKPAVARPVGRPRANLTDEQRKEKARLQRRRSEKTILADENDIGKLPKCQNPDMVEACRNNLLLFLKTYLPEKFYLEFSPDHLKVIAQIQEVVLESGLYINAMPRSSGKSSCVEGAVIWAMVYGHREFVMLFGSTEEGGKKLLRNIKDSFNCSDPLLHDFPEVVYPIRCLNRNYRRVAFQTYKGESTGMIWNAKQLALPYIEGTNAKGPLLSVAGITSDVRGLSYPIRGETIRPDLILIDDPSNKDSASSPTYNKNRWERIHQDILPLGGLKKAVACLCTATVIQADDLASWLLDQEISPEWNGTIYKLMNSMPTNMELWDEYRLHWNKSQEDGNKFYIENREKLDEGAEASWQQRYFPTETSAIQSAMNKYFQIGKEGFMCEYQNEPIANNLDASFPMPTVNEIMEQQSGFARYEVPYNTAKITAYIDVQPVIGMLAYTVVAVEPNFRTHVLDYGVYPEQPSPFQNKAKLARSYFDIPDSKGKLSKDPNGCMFRALHTLVNHIVERSWMRQGTSNKVPVNRILIDAAYETALIKKFVSVTKYKNIVMASRGKFVGPKTKPLEQYVKKHPTDVIGNGYWAQFDGICPHITVDTNAWKTHVIQSLLLDPDDSEAITLYKVNSKKEHELFAEHMLSQVPSMDSTKDKDGKDENNVRVWNRTPRDNEWFDCLTGAMAAACYEGITAKKHTPVVRKRVKVRRPKPKWKVNY